MYFGCLLYLTFSALWTDLPVEELAILFLIFPEDKSLTFHINSDSLQEIIFSGLSKKSVSKRNLLEF